MAFIMEVGAFAFYPQGRAIVGKEAGRSADRTAVDLGMRTERVRGCK